MKNFRKIFCVLMLTFIVFSVVACNDSKNIESLKTDTSNVAMEEFPKFSGVDFDGNKVDESIFKGKKATLFNFWFNGCAACVNEMPALEKFNETLKANNAELIGVNVEANSKDALETAKEILKKQNANYRNIYIDNSDETDKFLSQIVAFPTTIIVDENGKIIGEPIVGAIEDKKIQDNILNTIKNPNFKYEKNLDNDKTNQINKLNKDINDIFEGHKDIWDKIFANVSKEDAFKVGDEITYEKYLTDGFEKTKSKLTDEEQKVAMDDIKKISEIDLEINKLEKNKNL